MVPRCCDGDMGAERGDAKVQYHLGEMTPGWRSAKSRCWTSWVKWC